MARYALIVTGGCYQPIFILVIVTGAQPFKKKNPNKINKAPLLKAFLDHLPNQEPGLVIWKASKI